LPVDSSTLGSISRFFKSTNYRDFFRVLSDSLNDAVLVVTGENFQIQTCNHALLLLTGYTRAEVENLKLADLLHDDEGSEILAQLPKSSDKPNFCIENVSFMTRESEFTLVDLQVMSAGNLPSTLVLIGRPVRDRIQIEDQRRAQQERLENLVQMSALIIDDLVAGLPSALNFAERLLCASLIGTYLHRHWIIYNESVYGNSVNDPNTFCTRLLVPLVMMCFKPLLLAPILHGSVY
jgi:PAS domain S-box-containing protein